jgi:D-aminopeptidase
MLTYEVLSTDRISPLFEMVLEAVEEAVYNSLLQATPISSRFGTAEAIPIEALQRILQEYGVSKRDR